jgi:glycerol-3-phosphate acyltransferase PlsY
MTISPSFLLFLAYILGSLPFGFLLTRQAGLGDIRNVGSGNIGATNVLRTGKKALAAATLLLDMIKGSCAVGLASMTIPELAPLAGLAALLGHMFPLWLNFKGGKGVATFIGVLLALYWPLALMVSLVWLATALMIHISSLAALLAIASTVVFIDAFKHYQLLPAIILMIIFITIKHHSNIVRLLAGTEPEIGQPS